MLIYTVISLIIAAIVTIWEAGKAVQGTWTTGDVFSAIFTFILVGIFWPIMLIVAIIEQFVILYNRRS